MLIGVGEDKEALGTIEDAAAHERGGSRVSPGSFAEKITFIPNNHEHDLIRLGLFNYYNSDGRRVHFNREQPQHGTHMLSSYIDIYKYALLDGRRLTSTTRTQRDSAGSSLIQTHFNNEGHVGEVRHIFRHKQPGVPGSDDTIMVFVEWMKRSWETPLDDNTFIWGEDDFKELGVDTWEYRVYAAPTDPDYPPLVMPLTEFQCQVGRGAIEFTIPPLWITTTMDRFPTSLAAYGMGNAAGEEE
ncbi:hypothetical protein B0H11DRAFT_1932584 [Mycena galericulata]|nr:hypothetical protein B0H11DRAFT_1932584 [Mycena galericulata]